MFIEDKIRHNYTQTPGTLQDRLEETLDLMSATILANFVTNFDFSNCIF